MDDSFHSSAKVTGETAAVRKVQKLLREGPLAHPRPQALIGALQPFGEVEGGDREPADVDVRSALEWQLVERFAQVVQAHRSVWSEAAVSSGQATSLQRKYAAVISRLDETEAQCVSVSDTAAVIHQQLEVLEGKVRLATRLVRALSLTADEEAAIDRGVVDAAFLAACERLARIRRRLRRLQAHATDSMALREVSASLEQWRQRAEEALQRWLLHEVCVRDEVDLDEVPVHLGATTLQRLADTSSRDQAGGESVARTRRAVLARRFVDAMVRGDPARGVRPMEMSAHDALRYANDMLAWIHHALLAEHELVEALLPAEENRRLGDGVAAEAVAVNAADGPSSTGDTAAADIMHPLDDDDAPSSVADRRARILHELAEAVREPFRLRYEYALSQQTPGPAELCQLASLLEFYARVIGKLVGDRAALPTMLLELHRQALEAMLASWRGHTDTLTEIGLRVPRDLAPPTPLTQTLYRLEQVLTALEASMTAPQEQRRQADDLLQVALQPLLELSAAAATRQLAEVDQAVFLLNCYEGVRDGLSRFAVADDWVAHAAQQVERWAGRLEHLAARHLLARSRLLPSVEAIEQMRERSETDDAATPGTDIASSAAPSTPPLPRALDATAFAVALREFYATVFTAADVRTLMPPQLLLIANPVLRDAVQTRTCTRVVAAYRLAHDWATRAQATGRNELAGVPLRDAHEVALVLRGAPT
ncbi:hypothetical protein CDCA_CDCA17G4403 [Cyanidium caldarium]|uniref:Conserved Oligomeric Golgi complex subunit 6 C-terminal domain-containing protein n=1 Tax=Cyanidium caldarium TaxID=2771 RepID=A0AAV9J1B1_CYACA|nr:hypothetical protein CDCA_CDCA17G4403 [Cyanidium caldarium]